MRLFENIRFIKTRLLKEYSKFHKQRDGRPILNPNVGLQSRQKTALRKNLTYSFPRFLRSITQNFENVR